MTQASKKKWEMRLLLLLLALFTIASSAPINKHEVEAQQFFSSVFTAVKEDRMDKVMALFSEKYQHFMPGIYTQEQMSALEAAVVREGSVEDAERQRIDQIMAVDTAEFRAKILARVAALGKEAREYMEKAEEYKIIFAKLIGNCTKEMDSVIASFNALSKEAQAQLKEQFPIFGMLDEIRSYAVVLDRIVGGVKTVCAELPDFQYCRLFRN